MIPMYAIILIVFVLVMGFSMDMQKRDEEKKKIDEEILAELRKSNRKSL